jgi:ribosomal protein S27AE
MLVETAVERYKFVCGRCGYAWTADFDVQYVTDADGDTFAFYRLDGTPTPSPTGGEILCPNCGAGKLAVLPLARRDSPAARLDGDEPRQHVTTTAEQRRTRVPHLTALIRTGIEPGAGASQGPAT